MLLLPLLTGLSVVLHGTSSYVVGVHNTGDYGVDKFSDILQRLRDYDTRLKEQKRKQDIQLQNIQEDNANFDSLDREINLAAADAPEDPIYPDQDDTGVPAAATDPPSNDAPTTTKVKPTGAAPHAPPAPLAQSAEGEGGHVTAVTKKDFLFAVIVSACSVVGFVGLIMAGVCWYKLHRRVKAASDVDYPAYGVTGPTKERLPSPGDRKLAQSAQMYHYQHQKQQMIAMEKANGEMKQDGSEDESEEENEEGDYTVYECPGLAPTGEMEVRNPLFTEEPQTPVNGQGPAAAKLPDDADNSQE